QKLNNFDHSDFDGIRKILKELFGKCENLLVIPPFHCDYGKNIEAGDGFFANYNCTILDSAKVAIGENVLLGPNVVITTSGHAIHPIFRKNPKVCIYAKEIKIGSQVWIGANSVICPGVTISDNVVIDAGSIATKDIPEWLTAAGNPCRVIRSIKDNDKKYFFKDEEFDEEILRYLMIN
ncbi:MAG: sugar O-acetyltransferase, partial [Erysipelotrichaceae bacterium]